MKRNLLAVAIPALLVAGAANAVELFNKDGNKLDVYGRVKAMNYTSVGNDGDKRGADNDQSSARLGFLGETQITEDLIGYGRAEWEKGVSGDTSVDTRYAYAGFKFSNWGSVDYGKNDGVLKSVFDYTDVLPEFGGDATNEHYLLRSRSDSVLTYRNDNFFGLVEGLKVALQYQDQDSSGNDAEAYGISAEYAIFDTGLSATAGYARSAGDFTADGVTDNARTWSAGLKYDQDNLYMAAIYADSKHGDRKYRDFEVVAQYAFEFEVGTFKPSVA